MLLLVKKTVTELKGRFQIKIQIGDEKSVRCDHTKIPQSPEVLFPSAHGRTRYQSIISDANPPAAAVLPLHMSLRNYMDTELS